MKAPVFILCAALALSGQEKRSRQGGLQAAQSSSTAGAGNLHLDLFGRTFLWDNRAATKIPPTLPHGELNYGVGEYVDVSVGFNAMSYVFQPGYAYARVKATPLSNKAIRLLGLAGQIEARKQLFEYFPSDGYRVRSEGFGPEGFVFGNDDFLTSLRATAIADLDLIRLSSRMPLKLYLNAGWEGEFSSHIGADNRARSAARGVSIPEPGFAKIPIALGVEFKTFTTDFFLEAEADPFLSNLAALSEGAAGWRRFHVVGKTFDVSLWESPAYLHIGGRLKYGNGLELQGGLSWLISQDIGPLLGPCHAVNNPCREGATDGFSPFFPQWKIFGRVRYPLRFTQPSSELYRSFLLRRYRDKTKRLDAETTLGAAQPSDQDEERKRRLEERRKEADAQNVELD